MWMARHGQPQYVVVQVSALGFAVSRCWAATLSHALPFVHLRWAHGHMDTHIGRFPGVITPRTTR